MRKVAMLLVICLCAYSFAKVVTGRTERIERDVVPTDVTQETSKLEFYPTISYQGLLKDSEGKLIADGSYSLTFSVYDAEEAKEKIWKEVQTVEIKNGIVNCYVGAVEKLNLPFDKQYWLSVTIGEDELPRMLMSGTPYSLHARRIAEDAIVAGKNISVTKAEDGKLRISGSGDLKNADGTIYNLYDGTATGSLRNVGSVDSLGTYATALGYNNVASGNYSFATGRNCRADTLYAFASGYGTRATGYASTALGTSTKADGFYSFASGQLSESPAAWSFASGYNSKATGWYSTALGNICKAYGDDSFAAGYDCTAQGSFSVSMGHSNLADSTSCTALGNHTIAKDYFSTSTGNGTEATGNSAFSMGSYTKARGSVSIATGIQTKALAASSHTFGTYFSNKYSNSFMIKFAGTLADSSSTGAALFVNKNKVCIGLNDTEIDSMNIYHSSTEKALFVDGDIYAQNLNLQTNVWADYVFGENYNLKPLNEVEKFIEQNKHLPGVIPESEALAKGVNVGDVQVKLLEKIEELTLYIIEQDKKIKNIEEKIK